MLIIWETVAKIIEIIGYIIEYIGLGVIIASIGIALYKLPFKKHTMNNVRNQLAKRIIFGLEFVIAADILLVTVASNFAEIAQLGGIVIIRVLLGYAMRKEIIEQK